MNGIGEKRKYQRSHNVVCDIFVSEDLRNWTKVELEDISAGGLKFDSNQDLLVGENLVFNLHIYNMLSEFNFSLSGVIIRKENDAYSASFNAINKYNQIQLDEIINSSASVKTQPVLACYPIFHPRCNSKHLLSSF